MKSEPEIPPVNFLVAVRDLMREVNGTFEVRVYDEGFLISMDVMSEGRKVSVFRQVPFEGAAQMKAGDFHVLTMLMSEEIYTQIGGAR